MPTIQEIIAKRKDLGDGATNVDARKALTATSQPAPAPTTPVVTPPEAITAPTPTPAPTAPVTPAPTSVTGVDGQQFTQAPVDPTTGLSKPLEPVQPTEPVATVAPAPIKSVTPVVAKTATPEVPTVDYTQAKGREQDIINNLNTFKAQNMTPEQIMKASDYANATPEKKAIIDPYLKQQVPTATAMYNNIVAKADIPDEQKTSLPYKIAQNRYLKANAFSTMTPSQLSNEMTNSKLIQGSQAYEDLKAMNPKLVQDTENLRIVNGSKQNIFTYINNPDGTPVKVNNLENTFAQDYLDDYGTFLKSIYTPQTQEEVKNAIYTQDVRDAQDKATSIEEELNAIEKDINSIKKDVEGELSGTGATGSRARLEKIARKEALQSEYDSVLKSYTTYSNKANNLINQNTAMYEKAYNQKQELIKAQTSAAGMKYANELALSQNQAEFEQKIAQQAQLANDPQTAITTMVEEYKKLGIPFTRSTQQIIQDFASSGEDLASYLTELQGQIQSKPEYQRVQAIQMGQLSDAEKLQAQYQQQTAMQDRTFSQQLAMNDVNFNQDVQKLAMQYDMNDSQSRTEFRRDLISKGMSETQADAIVRNETGNWNGVTGEKLLYAEDGTFIKSSLQKTTNPNGGIECAEYISKMVGSKVGSTWEEKKSLNNEKTGTIGSIAVWKPAKTGELAKYGHAGVIVGEDGDNWIIKSANYNVDGKISTDTIPKSEIEGYRTTKLGSTLSGGQNKEASALAQNILDGIGSLTDLTPTARKEVLPELDRIIKANSTDDKNRNMILKSAISTKEIDATSLQKLKDMETVKFQMSTIAKNLSSQDTGPILGKIREFNPYDTEAQVALAQLAGLTPKVARGIFGEVGVLTDLDLANYQKALPNLKSTEEKNKLVVEFMTKLLAEGYKNSLIQEAKAGRNVSNYISDYDALVGKTGAKPTMSFSDLKTELSNLFKKQ